MHPSILALALHPSFNWLLGLSTQACQLGNLITNVNNICFNINCKYLCFLDNVFSMKLDLFPAACTIVHFINQTKKLFYDK